MLMLSIRYMNLDQEQKRRRSIVAALKSMECVLVMV